MVGAAAAWSLPFPPPFPSRPPLRGDARLRIPFGNGGDAFLPKGGRQAWSFSRKTMQGDASLLPKGLQAQALA
jgi:hypothetical protein